MALTAEELKLLYARLARFAKAIGKEDLWTAILATPSETEATDKSDEH
jgi:hypothetical protein